MSLFVRLVIMVTLFITINKNFDIVLETVCLKENPVADSILEPRLVVVKSRSVVLTPLSTSPDIDQRRVDQEADLRGFDHGGRGVLMPWKQWEKEKFGGLHVGVVNMDRWLGPLMILAWVVIWVSFVFDLYLWSGSVFVFGLCFFFFFSFVLLWSRFEFLDAGFVFLVARFDLGRTWRTSCNVLGC